VSRFSYKPCGTLRMLWLALIYPDSWRERSCDRVIDHERGVRFQLTPEEQTLMIAISERMHEMRIMAGVPARQAGAFLTWPRVQAVRERAFVAVSDRRRGDDREWRRLVGMEADELAEWIEQVWEEVQEPQRLGKVTKLGYEGR
jgi:uncharacterized protein YijF (DUF1287 family)